MKNIQKIILITGLPGAGKTTFARTFEQAHIVNLDDFTKGKYRLDQLNWYVQRHRKLLVVEGLISGQGFYEVLNCIRQTVSERDNWHKRDRTIVEIYRFEDDRETCLMNDRIRGRSKGAAITIQNLNIVVPPLDELTEHFSDLKLKFKLMKKKVRSGNPAELWAREELGLTYFHETTGADYAREKGLYYYGPSWSTGGTAGSCWDDTLTQLSPGTPEDFDEFDKLMEALNPNMTFLQYRKIKRATAKLVNYSYSDYYGGTQYYDRWVLDLNALYEIYKEMNEEADASN